MSERSVAEVKARLAAQQRKKDRIIPRQSFFCKQRHRLVNPAFCHDCFASMPYLKRLLTFDEDRTKCIAANRIPLKGSSKYSQADDPAPRKKKTIPARDTEPRYSIEDYACRGLLEFGLEVDALSERFRGWCGNLADPVRKRLHQSAELQEMVVWFAERLQEFGGLLVMLGRSPEESTNIKERKEETCGAKN